MNKRFRLLYALYLSWYALAWIWMRFFEPPYNKHGATFFHETTLSFSVCMHCDERFSKPGLLWCQQCIDEMREEYMQEMEKAKAQS